LTSPEDIAKVMPVMSMIAISLQSGSNGNCIFIEADGVKLLFDAGITGAQAEERLAAYDRNIREVDAVIISHDHGDHIRHAGVFQRKFSLPLFMTPSTLAAASSRCSLGKLQDVHHFRSTDKLRFGNVIVYAIRTPHDGVDGSVFVIEAGKKRLGVLTDLGHVFQDLIHIVSSLDAVFLESNYDPAMLAAGPYPMYLKQRIKGPHGHLSNQEAAELLCRAAVSRRLQWACLAHLSEQNNHPDIALKTHREVITGNMPIYIADRYRATEILTVL
jgi:phosphoribosyl 1,2-cyclic phosphodiesterase